MKIKVKQSTYEEVLKLPGFQHQKPKKPSMFFRTLLKTLSVGELKKAQFELKKNGMEQLKDDEPCLFLMNHSSFIDLQIASVILYPRPF